MELFPDDRSSNKRRKSLKKKKKKYRIKKKIYGLLDWYQNLIVQMYLNQQNQQIILNHKITNFKLY